MPEFLVLILFLCSFSSTKSAIAYDEIACETDDDCPIDKFCYTVSNLCAPCRTKLCFNHNRADSPWRKCHRKVSDCGGCLEGFEEEILTDGTARHSCVSITPVPDKLSSGKDNSSTYFWVYVGISCGLIIAVTLFVVTVFTRRASRYQQILQIHHFPAPQPENVSRTSDSPDNSPSDHRYVARSLFCSPPSYSTQSLNKGAPLCETLLNKKSSSAGLVENIPLATISPSAPPYRSESPIVLQSFGNVIREKLQQANPFRTPNYEDHSNSEVCTLEDRTSDEIEEEDNTDYESPIFLDENTMPSDWTPSSTSTSEEGNSASSCNSSNDDARTKRTNDDFEPVNCEPESCSERKRMKPDGNNATESQELQRPFQCLGQQNTHDSSNQKDDCSE